MRDIHRVLAKVLLCLENIYDAEEMHEQLVEIRDASEWLPIEGQGDLWAVTGNLIKEHIDPPDTSWKLKAFREFFKRDWE